MATDDILKRSKNREQFWSLAVKMLAVAKMRNIRLIMENPWNEQTYLKANFVLPPTIVDNDRSIRGDYFKKPTAYWFICCTPTHGCTVQKDKTIKRVLHTPPSTTKGICSADRSMISPDYARNFICDFILGRPQPEINPTLFDAI